MLDKHSAKKIVIIDSNAWNFLYENRIDISSSIFENYKFSITWEVKKEMEQLSNMDNKKDIYKYFIENTDNFSEIKKPFGFYVSGVPNNMQRHGGFGQGPFMSDRRSTYLAARAKTSEKKRKTLLFKNETDLKLASSAYGNVYILTSDFRKGPLSEITNIIKLPTTPMSSRGLLKLLNAETK